MPMYDAVCAHGHKEVIFSKIAQRDEPRYCEQCSGLLTRLISAPAVRPDIQAYQSPATGKWVDSRAKRRDDLRRSGCIEWEPGIREQAETNRQQALEKNFRAVEATVDTMTRELHSAGQI